MLIWNVLAAYLIEPEEDAHEEQHADTDNERCSHASLNLKAQYLTNRPFFLSLP
jgi:hypothetical protein